MHVQKGFSQFITLGLIAAGIVIGLLLLKNPQVFSPKASEAPTVAVKKLYFQKHNTWTWADNQSEINNLISGGYEDKGVLFHAFLNGNQPGTVPLYRLTKAYDYYWPAYLQFMTVNKDEVSLLTKIDPHTVAWDNYVPTSWVLKDNALYVYPPTGPGPNSIPVYRLMHNDPANTIFYGHRYYSTDPGEISSLMATGKYINEGIAFYGHNPAAPSPSPSPLQSPSPSQLSSTSPSPSPNNPADLDNNNAINIYDFNIFISDFNSSNLRSDVDKDGDVDIFDFNEFLRLFRKGL